MRLLTGVVAVLFILAGFSVLMADEQTKENPVKKVSSKEKAEKLMAAWDEAVKVAEAMTPEQKKEKEAAMKLAAECPCFQAQMATKVFMKKAIHANWYIYGMCCKDCKEGEMCAKCKEMMAKLPEEMKHKLAARHEIVKAMADLGQKVMDSMKKICPAPECEFCKPIVCDIKDLAAMKAHFEALTKEADTIVAMWKEVPNKCKALPEEKQKELKALAEKMKDCPICKVEKKTCRFMSGAISRLVKIDEFLVKSHPKEKCKEECKEGAAMCEAWAASAAMDAKLHEITTAMHEVEKSMKPAKEEPKKEEPKKDDDNDDDDK